MRACIFILFVLMGWTARPAAAQNSPDSLRRQLCPPLHRLIETAGRRQLQELSIRSAADSASVFGFDPRRMYRSRVHLPDALETCLYRGDKGYASYTALFVGDTATQPSPYPALAALLEDCLRRGGFRWTKQTYAETRAVEWRVEPEAGSPVLMRLYGQEIAGLPDKELVCLLVVPESVLPLFD